MVEIDEFAPQRTRQASPYGGLAGAHHPHQKDRQVVRQERRRLVTGAGYRVGGLLVARLRVVGGRRA
ncbi:hypothetical protein FC389_18835 [Bordetella pertussis]